MKEYVGMQESIFQCFWAMEIAEKSKDTKFSIVILLYFCLLVVADIL